MSVSKELPQFVVDVVWHPNFSEGMDFACEVYRNLNRDTLRLLENRPSLAVRFWTDLQCYRTAEGGSRSRTLLLLLDDTMLKDGMWRSWLQDKLQSYGTQEHVRFRRVVPIVITSRKHLAAQLTGTLNYLQPTIRPLAQDQGLMDGILATILDNITGDKLSYRVFICYSRQDQLGLRDSVVAALRACPYLEPFYDEQDLVGGAHYRERFKKVIRDGAVLILWTDSFSSRFETIYELLFAKREGRPVVVLLGLKDRDPRAFPYIGNAPIICPSSDPLVPGPSLTRALLNEILCNELARRRMEAASRRLRKIDTRNVSWLSAPPDLASLVHMATNDREIAEVCIYPDPPISPIELELIGAYYPNVAFLTPVQCRAIELGVPDRPTQPLTSTHQETRSFIDSSRPLSGMTIQLSVSDPSLETLSQRGLHMLHLEEIVIEFARHLIASGANIMFGGFFGTKTVGEYLLRIQTTYGRELSIQAPRVEALLPFPVGMLLDPSGRETLGRTLDYKVDDAPEDILSETSGGTCLPQDDLAKRIVWARCLTKTRRSIAHSVNACIVIGGKESGFQGRYAGVVEEALMAIKADTPLFLVGLLGGAARSIFDVMTGRQMKDPPLAFDVAAQRSDATYADFQDAYNARFDDERQINYQTLKEEFRRSGLEGLAKLNQLEVAENKRLANTNDLEESISLVLRALAQIQRTTTS